MGLRSAAPRRGFVAVSVALVVALGGCTLVPTNDARFNFGVPGEVQETITGVAYYPACGNTPLELDGVTWYPYVPTNLDEFPMPSASGLIGGRGFSRAVVGAPVPVLVVPAVARAAVPAVPAVARAIAPAVAAPGPGDDVGTVVIYDNGLAHFTSDSGNLTTWLTTKKITYAWVC